MDRWRDPVTWSNASQLLKTVAGALLVNLRNIIDALDVVAGAQPVEVPAPSALST